MMWPTKRGAAEREELERIRTQERIAEEARWEDAACPNSACKGTVSLTIKPLYRLQRDGARVRRIEVGTFVQCARCGLLYNVVASGRFPAPAHLQPFAFTRERDEAQVRRDGDERAGSWADEVVDPSAGFTPPRED